jgi:hypothetical protein
MKTIELDPASKPAEKPQRAANRHSVMEAVNPATRVLIGTVPKESEARRDKPSARESESGQS